VPVEREQSREIVDVLAIERAGIDGNYLFEEIDVP